MSEAQKIKDLVQWVRDIHTKNADGCKGSCHKQTVGYEHIMYGEPEAAWVARFGGYCFGDMSRHSEIRANTLDELIEKTKSTIISEIKKYEGNII